MDMLLAIVQIISTLILAIGLFVTAKQFYNSNLQERMKNVVSLWNLLNEPEIREIYYKIEYDKFHLDSQFLRSNEEKYLDKMLHVYDLYAKLYNYKLIKIDDIDIIAYEFLCVYNNPEIQRYLIHIESLTAQHNATNPFADFNAFGQKLVAKNRSSK